MKFNDLSRRNFITAVTATTVATAFSNVIPAFGNTPPKPRKPGYTWWNTGKSKSLA